MLELPFWVLIAFWVVVFAAAHQKRHGTTFSRLHLELKRGVSWFRTTLFSDLLLKPSARSKGLAAMQTTLVKCLCGTVYERGEHKETSWDKGSFDCSVCGRA